MSTDDIYISILMCSLNINCYREGDYICRGEDSSRNEEAALKGEPIYHSEFVFYMDVLYMALIKLLI